MCHLLSQAQTFLQHPKWSQCTCQFNQKTFIVAHSCRPIFLSILQIPKGCELLKVCEFSEDSPFEDLGCQKRPSGHKHVQKRCRIFHRKALPLFLYHLRAQLFIHRPFHFLNIPSDTFPFFESLKSSRKNQERRKLCWVTYHLRGE